MNIKYVLKKIKSIPCSLVFVLKSIIYFSGKPQKAVINSSPEGLYRNKYNLTWTVKSLEPLTEVRLLFRMMVSSFLNMFQPLMPRNYSASKFVHRKIFNLVYITAFIYQFYQYHKHPF